MLLPAGVVLAWFGGSLFMAETKNRKTKQKPGENNETKNQVICGKISEKALDFAAGRRNLFPRSPPLFPMPARAFLFDQSQAGCFHVVNRIYDRKYLLDWEGKELLLKLVRAYEDVLGVEVLTFCIMDNHFHLLVRVPHRPEGFDVPLEVVVARLDRALGEESAGLMHRNLDFWRTTKNEAAIEAWRRQQVARMFSLSEFMKAVQLRFSRWYNRRAGRKGTLWESRYTSVIVEEEERALRTMAAYIDLNPVRAGMVADPADYRWIGYAEAMAGKARSRRGLVRIIGQMAWPRESAAGAMSWAGPMETMAMPPSGLRHTQATFGPGCTKPHWLLTISLRAGFLHWVPPSPDSV